MSLAEKGNWDEDFKQDENENNKSAERPKIPYMDLTKPGKYQCRPVGPHVKCRKFFKPYRATLQDSDRDTDPAWGAGFYPSRRYAINVIDRSDGKLKVLEKGSSVFKYFANYKATSGKNPSDVKEGSDFAITVKVPKLPNGEPNKLKTEYLVMPIKETPLTTEEIAMIQSQKLWPLTDIYKSTPLEKRQEVWNSLPDSAKIPPKRDNDSDNDHSESQPANDQPVKDSKVAEETMSNAPSASQDLFDDSEEANKEESAELF